MINIFLALEYDKKDGPITKVHTYASSYLNRQKFRIYMFYRERGNEKPPQSIIPLKVPRLKSHPTALSTYKTAIQLFANILRIKTDIIHIPIYPDVFPIVFLRKYLKLDKKLILSFHGVPLDSYKHFLVSKIYARNSNALTSVSHFTARLVKRIYNLDSVVIHNGVDTNFYYPKNHYNGRPRVLFVGRFIKWKRPHWVARLAKKFPQADFIIHGKPPKTGISVYPYLLETAKKVSNLKISTAHLSAEELRDLYQTSDIFCFPSTDWHPLSTMEAMASGLPLIVHRIGGQGELIDDGKEGFKISSYADLESKMEYILEDENLRHKMSKHAREKALKYDWKAVAKRYEKLYEDLVYDN